MVSGAPIRVNGAAGDTFPQFVVGECFSAGGGAGNLPVILVKRRSTILESVLRETVLPPIYTSNKLRK